MEIGYCFIVENDKTQLMVIFPLHLCKLIYCFLYDKGDIDPKWLNPTLSQSYLVRVETWIKLGYNK